jgi:hypothetical protein
VLLLKPSLHPHLQLAEAAERGWLPLAAWLLLLLPSAAADSSPAVG